MIENHYSVTMNIDGGSVMKLSNRIESLQASPIRKLIPLALQAKAEGKHVYHLNIGQPDIETPSVFLDAIHQFNKKIIPYQLSTGDPNLIKSIQTYYERDHIKIESDEIIITNGGSEALIFSLMAICDSGDEVLIPEPFYTNYNGFTTQTGVMPVPITTLASTGFHLPTQEEIEKLITEKTKAILFSNPGNPTGTVYTLAELEMLKAIALKHHLFLISDEVYRKFVFDEEVGISLGMLKGIEQQSIMIESVSKRYSSCGARIGAVVSKNKELIAQILKLAQSRLSISTLDQVGASALYLLDDDYVSSIKNEYQKRRDIVVSGLNEIPNIFFEIPKGAFYIVVTLPVKDAEEYTKWLLSSYTYENETVMLAPARDFYVNKDLGVRQVRIAYVLESNQLKKAMKILKYSLELYLEIEK